MGELLRKKEAKGSEKEKKKANKYCVHVFFTGSFQMI